MLVLNLLLKIINVGEKEVINSWKGLIIPRMLNDKPVTCIWSELSGWQCNSVISNLQFISKLTERAVFDQLQTHMLDHALYPLLQSAYRKSHSTETALIKVQDDILMTMDRQQVTLLVMITRSQCRVRHHRPSSTIKSP